MPKVKWEELSEIKHHIQRNYEYFAKIILEMRVLNDAFKETLSTIDKMIEDAEDV